MREMLEEVLGMKGAWGPGRMLSPMENMQRHRGKHQGQPNIDKRQIQTTEGPKRPSSIAVPGHF